MGKVLVFYVSRNGNTEKMARHVAEGAAGLENTEVRLRSVHDATVDDLRWCDGIALGAATNLGSIPWEMKKWWDDLVDEGVFQKIDGKIGCAFSSSGGWGGGAELACMALLTVLMNYGFLVFGVTDYVAPQFTLHYGSVVAGEPRSEREIESCRRLGRRLAEWVAVLRDGRPEADPIHSTYRR